MVTVTTFLLIGELGPKDSFTIFLDDWRQCVNMLAPWLDTFFVNDDTVSVQFTSKISDFRLNY